MAAVIYELLRNTKKDLISQKLICSLLFCSYYLEECNNIFKLNKKAYLLFVPKQVAEIE